LNQTQQNLKNAFAGESQASQKYLVFAAIADKEGFPAAARLFRAAAEAERVHAARHLEASGEAGTTAQNLKKAISGENYEFTEMYPPFITQARVEGHTAAELSFSRANAVEQIHHGLFQRALAEVESEERGPGAPYYVCQVCGHTVTGQAPDKCPTCGAPHQRFSRVD